MTDPRRWSQFGACRCGIPGGYFVSVGDRGARIERCDDCADMWDGGDDAAAIRFVRDLEDGYAWARACARDLIGPDDALWTGQTVDGPRDGRGDA